MFLFIVYLYRDIARKDTILFTINKIYSSIYRDINYFFPIAHTQFMASRYFKLYFS